ncbi:MAG: hypothetical protein ABFC97_00645 [Anaerolineaceae bacterium]
MTINYDLKGKYFTDVINKEALAARIQTTNQVIEGNIHVRPAIRLKDELSSDEPILAVTDAVVFDSSMKELFRTQFLALRRDQIVWITALNDIVNGE